MPSTPDTESPSFHALTYKEKLLRNRRDITPIDEPLLSFDNGAGNDGKLENSPSEYLKSYAQSYGAPFGRRVAEWRHEFVGAEGDAAAAEFRTEPEVPPLRPGAPTVVLLFYPRPDEAGARPVHRTASYLRRIARVARLGEQTLLYVPPSLRGAVAALRPAGDPRWRVVDAWESVWDMPCNAHQRDGFAARQPARFAAFDGHGEADGDLRPEPRYNAAHHSAVCNAKAFVMYDAVMRNPFGSDRWMYVDAGFLFDDGPRGGEAGEPWGELFAAAGLDEAKFERAIAGASGDTGVVMGEYAHGRHGWPDASDECWRNPRRSWRARQFIAQVYVGSSLGMLNYSARFLRTVEDMDAGGFYVGREELVVAFVALRYPNTVFSVPYFRLPPRLDYPWQFPMKLVFSRVGGPESVPPIVDPLATLYCKGYVPRRESLPAGGIYKGCAAD